MGTRLIVTFIRVYPVLYLPCHTQTNHLYKLKGHHIK